MANINSISNSYSSSGTGSLYGTKNIISGLASGMDTESMIQNSVTGYQTKITSLQQDVTSLQWKQDAFREITNQMASITDKYTSYISKTNLSSNGFFTGATITTALGSNAEAISATGKATSEIRIDAVTQLATAARYSVQASALNFNNTTNLTGTALTTTGQKQVSSITGSLTLTAGSNRYTLEFGEDDVYQDAQAMVDGINEKLRDQRAEVSASLVGGQIKFSSTSGRGDSVYLSGASGKLKTNLGVQYAASSAAEDRFTYNTINVSGRSLNENVEIADYLSNKTIDVTLNGVTKKISLGTLSSTSGTPVEEQIVSNLQDSLNRAFGSGSVSVSLDNGALSFAPRDGSNSTLSAKSSVSELGLGTGLANYLSTDRKLDSLLGEDYFKVKGDGDPTMDGNGGYVDASGNRVNADGYRLDSSGSVMYEEKDLVINGVTIGKYGKGAALDEVMNAINNNAEAGVRVSYSRLTGEFVFNATNTGAGQAITMGDGLGKRLFGDSSSVGSFTAGTDAQVRATVNGRELTISRSTNVIDMDGMSVTLKKTFTEGDAVTFKTGADSDKVVDAVKSFVEDVNKLMTDLHSAYTTQPAEKNSKHERYRPLTDDDKKDMSESAVKAYEEKAKQGLLFGDNDLRQLYDRLRSVIQPSGSAMGDLKDIGITAEYSNGVSTLKLNEDKLREALESNPDKVRTVFATTQNGGTQVNGLVGKLKTTLDAYGSTSMGSPGILVRKAGSKLSSNSLTNNDIQKQINNVNKQIENWQTKLSNRVDYYTKQFTALEKMIATLNNQSSMLMDLSGG